MTVLDFPRGTTFTIGIEYQRNGVATTLVGATVRFTMKTVEFDSDMDDSTALISIDATDGNSAGVITMVITPDMTAELEPTVGNAPIYYYDIKVEDAAGDIFTLDEGYVRLGASPTNRGPS